MEPLSYNLPQDRIAFRPSEKRGESKLLAFNGGEFSDHKFSDLVDVLGEEYSLVLNETRVLNARVYFQKPTGGSIEVFCLEPASGDISTELEKTESVLWKCLVGGAKKWKEGKVFCSVSINGSETILEAEKVSDENGVFILKFSWLGGLTFAEILESFGKIPLPPYIRRKADEQDADRYQTVFANAGSSVAAPTASLHFTKDLLSKLKDKQVEQVKVNLHVGAGTFKPISSTVMEHEMHHEMIEVSVEELRKMISLRKLVAVGTTAVRTLESLFILANSLAQANEYDLSEAQEIKQWEWKDQKLTFSSYQDAFGFLVEALVESSLKSIRASTNLMIVPGFEFRVVSGLITNFHMPKSTLLLLVSAFIGPSWKDVYDHALENGYQFLSYGDSSLLLP